MNRGDEMIKINRKLSSLGGGNDGPFESTCGEIKDIITDYDHVNDDPHKIISKINDLLDNVFGGNY